MLASISDIVVTQKLFDPVEAALMSYFQTLEVLVTLPAGIDKCFLHTSVWWREENLLHEEQSTCMQNV